jgi:BirA family biotin operon repressor/biotin-[acetyl-CoA-carboxylase] ligase
MSPDAHILTRLRRSGGAGVALSDLTGVVAGDPIGLPGRIAALRQLGYDITSTVHGGFVLRSGPDRLHADDLVSRLPDRRRIGRTIQVFQETSSTNDVVERLARDGVEEGAVVFAESQTQGRGRMGRRWESPSGRGLWFSVLLRPRIPLAAATQLTVMAAVAAARAIGHASGLEPEIKWPNDLHLRGQKCGGILLELGAESDQIHHVILGMGIDVNLSANEIPPQIRGIATSLSQESGRTMDRPALAAQLLEELDSAYEGILTGRFSTLADEWERRCTTLGRRVAIRVGPREIHGLAEALDEQGALLLRTEHGRLERIIGGEVSLLSAAPSS